MARFKFRLEKVKQYRDLIKKEAERALLEKRAEANKAEETLHLLSEEKNRIKIDTDGILTAGELQVLASYEEFLLGLLKTQKQVVEDTNKAVEKAREVFIDKAKDERALSLLKDKKYEEYREEETRRQKKEFSEIAINLERREKIGD
jgi:flagellar export protein FliJ